MKPIARARAHRHLHHHAAILLAASTPALVLVDVIVSGFSSAMAPIIWSGYLVLIVWALILIRRRRPNTLPLVLAAVVFYSFLSVAETLTGRDITALDFTAVYGLIVILLILAGVLVSEGTYGWAVGAALYAGGWSVYMGVARGDGVAAVAIRTAIAAVSVVFAAVLLSRLLDLLAQSIWLYNRSARLHNAIARCSEALLVEPDASAVDEAVRALLEATEADYAYVDMTVEVDGEPGWEIIAEASTGGFGVGGWNIGSYVDFPTLYAKLTEGEAVVVRTADLEGNERALYERDGIKSEVVVPIFVDGEMRGSIGFVQYSEERSWDDHEIQTLWRAADMVAAYWRRQEDSAKLRASNEAKDRLLASVSHEIRTPLAAIVGLSGEIADGGEGLSEEELRELNGIIATQSRELAELVEDLLVASKADTGDLSVRREVLELATQVDQVLDGIGRSVPDHKQIAFRGGSARVWGDALRVRQVLRNLVTNALKYGGDQIVVSVENSEGEGRVRVSDNGAGIPAEEAELIFERYYRGSRSSEQVGSMGIGLSLARQLAQLMGGTVQYLPDDGWHSFILSLPAADPMPAPEEVPEAVAAG